MTVRNHKQRDLVNPRQWSVAALSGISGRSGRKTPRSELLGLLGRAAIALQDAGHDKWLMFRRDLTDAASTLQLAVLAIAAADMVENKALGVDLRLAALNAAQKTSSARRRRLHEIERKVKSIGAAQRRLGWGNADVPAFDLAEARLRRALRERDRAEAAVQQAAFVEATLSVNIHIPASELADRFAGSLDADRKAS